MTDVEKSIFSILDNSSKIEYRSKPWEYIETYGNCLPIEQEHKLIGWINVKPGVLWLSGTPYTIEYSYEDFGLITPKIDHYKIAVNGVPLHFSASDLKTAKKLAIARYKDMTELGVPQCIENPGESS